MNLIVNASQNWGIGAEGELLVSIPDDLKRFRAMTTGKTVIYGSLTMATFPGGRPLPNRRNIVFSRNPDFKPEGAEVAASLAELADAVRGDDSDDVFVIGGDSIYRLLLPYCKNAYVTRLDKRLNADRFFPDLDSAPNWYIAKRSEPQFFGDVGYRFVDYVNTQPRSLFQEED